MIKDKTITINGHSSNYKYYKSLGYDVQVRKPFKVKTKDLMKGSVVKVTTICDNCGKESLNVFKDYWNYTNGLKERYYCNSCNYIKLEKTSLKKYGVKNPMQSDKVKENLRNSIIDKYGVSWYSKTDEWLKKFKKTSLEKYGCDNPSKNKDIINDIRVKNSYLSGDIFKKNSKSKKERKTWKKYAELLTDEYKVIFYKDNIFKILHDRCNKEFDITKPLLYNRLKSNSTICLNCNEVNIMSSSFENEVMSYLDELNIDYEKRNRSLLNGQELDIYLKEYGLAIECNGVFWHNELYKSKSYHLNKTLKCKELGIELIHIWEDDWKLKKDIIKSIINYRLNIIGKKIWARKCKIKEVPKRDYKEFLKENHIQGFTPSTYKIGLYYKEELVSLMTFSYRKVNNKRGLELVRFCNKINLSVIGSASKLFKHFIKKYEVCDIISYSDISLFSGDVYKKLGFKRQHLSEPNYYWVVDGVRRHRYNFSKRKLVERGFSSEKTEVQIMHDLGYFRIFSTGQEKWLFKTF